MKVVWKFPITKMSHRPDVGWLHCDLLVTCGFTVLSFQVQNKVLCMWALVDPDARPETFQICLHATGYEYNTASHHHGDYYGTVQMWDGAHVVHIFSTDHLPRRANQL